MSVYKVVKDTWEVVAAINGNCVYCKQDLSKREARSCVNKIMWQNNGRSGYEFKDGEILFIQDGFSIWARPMCDWKIGEEK